MAGKKIYQISNQIAHIKRKIKIKYKHIFQAGLGGDYDIVSKTLKYHSKGLLIKKNEVSLNQGRGISERLTIYEKGFLGIKKKIVFDKEGNKISVLEPGAWQNKLEELL